MSLLANCRCPLRTANPNRAAHPKSPSPKPIHSAHPHTARPATAEPPYPETPARQASSRLRGGTSHAGRKEPYALLSARMQHSRTDLAIGGRWAIGARTCRMPGTDPDASGGTGLTRLSDPAVGAAAVTQRL